MNPRLASLFIPAGARLRDALQAIEAGEAKLAVMVDAEGRLLGTITDGDVRRGLLAGLSLDDPADRVVNRTPRVVADGEPRAAAHLIMRSRRLRHVPVVDAAGRVVDVVLFTELLRNAPLDTTAVIMAGGEGRRLRPHTETVPKPMLPVGGRPILETIIERFLVQGVRRFRIAVNYRAEHIIGHFGDGRHLGAEIGYLREDRPLGTAGSLGLLDPRPGHPLIVVNGDVLTTLRHADLLAAHRAAGAALTVCAQTYRHQIPFGVLETRDGRVTGIAEKPVLTHPVSAGIYVIEPPVLDLLPRDERCDMPDLIRTAIARGLPVHSFAMEDYWVDVGRLEDLEQADRDYAGIFEEGDGHGEEGA